MNHNDNANELDEHITDFVCACIYVYVYLCILKISYRVSAIFKFIFAHSFSFSFHHSLSFSHSHRWPSSRPSNGSVYNFILFFFALLLALFFFFSSRFFFFFFDLSEQFRVIWWLLSSMVWPRNTLCNSLWWQTGGAWWRVCPDDGFHVFGQNINKYLILNFCIKIF